jgi:hypothetical protein
LFNPTILIIYLLRGSGAKMMLVILLILNIYTKSRQTTRHYPQDVPTAKWKEGDTVYLEDRIVVVIKVKLGWLSWKYQFKDESGAVIVVGDDPWFKEHNVHKRFLFPGDDEEPPPPYSEKDGQRVDGEGKEGGKDGQGVDG